MIRRPTTTVVPRTCRYGVNARTGLYNYMVSKEKGSHAFRTFGCRERKLNSEESPLQPSRATNVMLLACAKVNIETLELMMQAKGRTSATGFPVSLSLKFFFLFFFFCLDNLVLMRRSLRRLDELAFRCMCSEGGNFETVR